MNPIILHTNLIINPITEQIVTFIPFEGNEKICWDCGGNREIIVRLDLNGELLYYDECCDK